MRRWIVLILVTLVGGVARADDPPEPPEPSDAPPVESPAVPAVVPGASPHATPEQAADAVLAAIGAKGDATLHALAATDIPDPWLVADELIRRGEFDAAATFARAAPRKDVEKLPDYATSRRGKPDDSERRKRVADVNAALGARRPQDAIDVSGAVDPAPPEDVSGVRLAFVRGTALQAAGRPGESAKAFLAAADAAERLGWLLCASRALNEGAKSARTDSDFRGALATWERVLQLDDARGAKARADARRELNRPRGVRFGDTQCT